jgi:tetratricopeptide (TPR) repeat protein
MPEPISPLLPIRPDPDKAGKKTETSTRTVLLRLRIPLVLTTALAFYLRSTALMLLGAVVWVGWGAYYILVTRILLPDGASTPSVNQHSNIATMVIRGQFAAAAEAYKQAILANPLDTVACEQLAQLALREMKDYPTAIEAYREAEKRSREPKRQLGYAIMVAGIYRDNVKDAGKAMGELGRILSRYPDAPNAARLRAELEELKTTHFEAS